MQQIPGLVPGLVTDNWPAILAALSQGGDWSIPAGQFLVRGQPGPGNCGMQLGNSFRLSGAGAQSVLVLAPGTTADLIDINSASFPGTYTPAGGFGGTAGFVIEDITLDGGYAQNIIGLHGVSDGLFRNVTFSRCNSALGIDAGAGAPHGCSRIRIEGCTFFECAENAIVVDRSDHVQVMNCLGNRIGSNGILTEGSSFCDYVGNEWAGNGNTNGFAGVRFTNNSQKCTVSGGHVTDFSRGVFILDSSMIAVDNLVLDRILTQAVLIQGGGTFQCLGNKVSGCVIGDCSDATSVIRVTGVTGLNSVIGNVLRNGGGGNGNAQAILDDSGGPNTIRMNVSNYPIAAQFAA